MDQRVGEVSLTPADLSAHAALGITPEMLAAAQVRRVDDIDARERLTSKHPGDLAGILYPYLSATNGRATTYRLRRDHPEMENGKPKDKYLSAWGDAKRLYFPPNCAALLADVDADVIIAEAEKSVLAIACAAESAGRLVLPVGTGGCWGWRGRIGKTEDANGKRVDETGVLPDFDYVTWTGRTAAIMFDANTAANEKVRAARRMLAKELTARGAVVRIVDVPAEPGVNGPDDYIGMHGAEAFFALVDGTMTVASTALICGKDSKPLHNDQENIRCALTQLGYSVAYDAFAGVTTMVQGSFAGALDDAAMQHAWLHVDSALGLRPTLQRFEIVVNNFARRRSHHPVLDYLAGLPPWDGVPRLDTWLMTYAGAEDTKFTRAAGALVLMAAVRRARKPGTKFDELLVLLGPQGLSKSKLLLALCPVVEWFTDSLSLGDDPKHVIENTRGIWIAEISDMQGTQREVERIKAFLSRSVDGPVRMAYGRIPVRAPRQFITFGTSNPNFFLKDTTGNRRFWPVVVSALRPELLERDRDQLWAETVLREAKGESIHLPNRQVAAAEVQERHRDKHPWEDLLEDVCAGQEGHPGRGDVDRGGHSQA